MNSTHPTTALTETEVGRESRELTLDCYVSAIRNIAHYAADLEPELTVPHRKYLEELAERTVSGTPAALQESRATLRGLLRDYRDKTSQYLSILRGDLSSAAVALEEILESLSDNDGDQGDLLHKTLRLLRQAPGDDCDGIRQSAHDAAETIENCLSAVRKRHQLAVSQFMIEIRMLHKRIDGLEGAASIDMATRLFPRHELEAVIREGNTSCRLILVRADGVLRAESRFGRTVAQELTGAVIRRLRNTLPAEALVTRWSEQGFVAMIELDARDSAQLAERISENLNGSYACVKEGKTVRPPIRAKVSLLEQASDAEETLRQTAAFFDA
jgi:GGDEF domain-containing protein